MAEDVKVNGLVVIPKGAMAWGTIVDAKLKRRLGRAGKLDVRIDDVLPIARIGEAAERLWNRGVTGKVVVTF